MQDPSCLTTRERVHQPWRDTLIRTSGYYVTTVSQRTNLFLNQGGDEGRTNLPTGATLPSDQSMVILALRVFTWFRQSIHRGVNSSTPDGSTFPSNNGDFQYNTQAAPTAVWSNTQFAVTGPNQAGSLEDVHRLYWQSAEQLNWTFGTGQKPSLISMPTAYLPYGGGLHGDLGGNTDLILWNNGSPNHAGILRLGRAICLPPRQNVVCLATITALPDGGNGTLFQSSQGARNMLDLGNNLSVADLINKVISFTFDGLFSRDVQ